MDYLYLMPSQLQRSYQGKTSPQNNYNWVWFIAEGTENCESTVNVLNLINSWSYLYIGNAQAYCFVFPVLICWAYDYDEWIQFCLNQEE